MFPLEIHGMPLHSFISICKGHCAFKAYSEYSDVVQTTAATTVAISVTVATTSSIPITTAEGEQEVELMVSIKVVIYVELGGKVIKAFTISACGLKFKSKHQTKIQWKRF